MVGLSLLLVCGGCPVSSVLSQLGSLFDMIFCNFGNGFGNGGVRGVGFLVWR